MYVRGAPLATLDGRPTHRPPPPQTAPQRGLLAEFFATLWPDNFIYQEPAELQHLADWAPLAEAAAAPAPVPAPLAPAAAPAPPAAAPAPPAAAPAPPAAAPAAATPTADATTATPDGGAAAGAATFNSTAALESLLYFLDSARTLLDSTLMRVREGEEGGDEGGESVEWAFGGEESEEEDQPQHEEDFIEDQDQQ
ncbi:hypothetical protein FHG87_017877 [Trinorchestia longiramus]|nr:hypothetical protein FHG87_017877 [Trinorchestia longiramus]